MRKLATSMAIWAASVTTAVEFERTPPAQKKRLNSKKKTTTNTNQRFQWPWKWYRWKELKLIDFLLHNQIDHQGHGNGSIGWRTDALNPHLSWRVQDLRELIRVFDQVDHPLLKDCHLMHCHRCKKISDVVLCSLHWLLMSSKKKEKNRREAGEKKSISDRKT